MKKTGQILICASLFSCAAIEPADLKKGKSKYHFGVVKISAPETDPRISAVKVQTLGLALDAGVTLGWRDREEVFVPLKEAGGEIQPLEATCGVVIIVRNLPEVQQAKVLLQKLEGKNVCVSAF